MVPAESGVAKCLWVACWNGNESSLVPGDFCKEVTDTVTGRTHRRWQATFTRSYPYAKCILRNCKESPCPWLSQSSNNPLITTDLPSAGNQWLHRNLTFSYKCMMSLCEDPSHRPWLRYCFPNVQMKKLKFKEVLQQARIDSSWSAMWVIWAPKSIIFINLLYVYGFL